MKLVCDSCGTRYSIGDDRVAGKVFKIRCKRCANVIVVRGAPAPEPEPSTAPTVDGPSGEWHAVIDGMQSGPFSRVELVRKHAAGELHDDSFVWREGLADWVALGTLDELRSELAPQVNEPPAADGPRLLAERNASSVLFTLNNLAQLASSSPKAPPATATASTGTEGSGLIDIRALASTFAPAKLAKPVGTIGSEADVPVFGPTTFGEPIVFVPAARSKGPDRRLLVALIATVAMLAVLAVVLVIVLRGREPEPVAAEPTPTRVATVGAPVGAEQNGTTQHDTTATSTGPNGIAPTGTARNGTATGTGQNGGTAPNGIAPVGSTQDGTAQNGRAPIGPAPNGIAPIGSTQNGTAQDGPTAATTPTGTTTRTPRTGTGTTPTGGTPTTRTSQTSTRTTPTTRTPTLTPDKEPNSCTDVACAFHNYKDACCEKFRPARTTTTTNTQPTGPLNENLDRAQLAAGIATIRAQACGGRSSAKGDVSVSIKVSADGAVTSVTIKSSPDPALSACVTAAAQKGTFAKTRRGGSFAYLWRF